MVLSEARPAGRGLGTTEPTTAQQVSFRSILYGDAAPSVGDGPGEQPDFFPDLNLDQVVDALVRDRESYELRPFFFTSLHTVEQVEYRQRVLEELADDELVSAVRTFAADMRSMRKKLGQARTMHYAYQQAGWTLEAAADYGDAVLRLAEDLGRLPLTAPGWLGLRDYVTEYTVSGGFRAFMTETRDLRKRLGEITYCVRILGSGVTVTRFDGEADYSGEVSATFAKFRQGTPPHRKLRLAAFPDMNHVEAKVLEGVAQLHPELFAQLRSFAARHRDCRDATIRRFDREVQFYLAYLELIEPLRAAGLPFCIPRVHLGGSPVTAEDTFDLALAVQLVGEQVPVVGNDIRLTAEERILVVTGPNQGGKTTYARAFGQLHHLAALGLCVPGRSAELPLVDRIFSQFERGENMADLSGKLADDLTRMHAILGQATDRSVVVVNEVFTSTTLEDARFLGRQVLEHLLERGCLAVYVTFVDELASLSPEVVSVVSTVEPDDPARRTFKVLRRPADGLAYAAVLAEKYGLTPEKLAARIAS